jgi:hypothetical protein
MLTRDPMNFNVINRRESHERCFSSLFIEILMIKSAVTSSGRQRTTE